MSPSKSGLTEFRERDRRLYAFLTLLTIVLGLASRRFDAWLPGPLHKNTGDVLWAVMVYWLAALLFPARSVKFLVGISALYAIAIECSKLIHLPWLVAFRATTAGHLIFGAVFSWADLLDYGIGILLAAVPDRWIHSRSKHYLVYSHVDTYGIYHDADHHVD